MVRNLSKQFGLKPKLVRALVQKLFLDIRLALSRGHRVEIKNAGSLHPVINRSKSVYDFVAMKPAVKPNTIGVKFNPSRKLKKELLHLSRLYRSKGAL